jgi:hypothetical protein
LPVAEENWQAAQTGKTKSKGEGNRLQKVATVSFFREKREKTDFAGPKTDLGGPSKRVFQGYSEAFQGLKEPASSPRRGWTGTSNVSALVVGHGRKER